ncbi:hydrogenase nickel incorporation protein HypB [Piscinibacter sakaiensis]|uniref:hydrogenase nickel incorporation protein HypB n=1 Tax=Piscinibacter sakaiensis TaxID=1547922 RepID=UPI003AAB6C73
MCVVCGCGDAKRNMPVAAGAGPASADDTLRLDFGAGAARVSVPGMSQARAIKLEADVLGANQRLADRNRAHFAAHRVSAYNLVSSPGAGKTSLLCATIGLLQRRAPGLPLAVIEGDQQTSHDAERIRASGAAAVQVNTGKGCHLDARMVAAAFERLPLHAAAHHDAASEIGALLLIENVGNLVCPALWDLGEQAKVAILSVTEGDDKPAKYPDMFAAAGLMVINKIDLLPHVDFDLQRCIDFARRVNPDIEVMLLSARTGDGLERWVDWLLGERPGAGGDSPLDRRVRDVQAHLRPVLEKAG